MYDKESALLRKNMCDSIGFVFEGEDITVFPVSSPFFEKQRAVLALYHTITTFNDLEKEAF